jgi:hypothetical protein
MIRDESVETILLNAREATQAEIMSKTTRCQTTKLAGEMFARTYERALSKGVG